MASLGQKSPCSVSYHYLFSSIKVPGAGGSPAPILLCTPLKINGVRGRKRREEEEEEEKKKREEEEKKTRGGE